MAAVRTIPATRFRINFRRASHLANDAAFYTPIRFTVDQPLLLEIFQMISFLVLNTQRARGIEEANAVEGRHTPILNELVTIASAATKGVSFFHHWPSLIDR